MIEWVQVNQRVNLAEKIANGYACRFAVFGKFQHNGQHSSVFYFSLDDARQYVPIYAVKKFTYIQL